MHMVFPYIVGRKALKPFNVCDQTSNFMSKIRTFAHRFCNSKTCLHYLMPGMTCVFFASSINVFTTLPSGGGCNLSSSAVISRNSAGLTGSGLTAGCCMFLLCLVC